MCIRCLGIKLKLIILWHFTSLLELIGSVCNVIGLHPVRCSRSCWCCFWSARLNSPEHICNFSVGRCEQMQFSRIVQKKNGVRLTGNISPTWREIKFSYSSNITHSGFARGQHVSICVERISVLYILDLG